MYDRRFDISMQYSITIGIFTLVPITPNFRNNVKASRPMFSDQPPSRLDGNSKSSLKDQSNRSETINPKEPRERDLRTQTLATRQASNMEDPSRDTETPFVAGPQAGSFKIYAASDLGVRVGRR